MGRITIALAVLPVLALGGCERFSANGFGPQLTDGSGTGGQQVAAAALSATNIRDFVDPDAARQMSGKDQLEATSAQYYALQFGRPGAPRSWQGDSGASGKVSVGPYVRVNVLDCRDFSHLVAVGGKSYERSGTACREADGSWSVSSS